MNNTIITITPVSIKIGASVLAGMMTGDNFGGSGTGVFAEILALPDGAERKTRLADAIQLLFEATQ